LLKYILPRLPQIETSTSEKEFSKCAQSKTEMAHPMLFHFL